MPSLPGASEPTGKKPFQEHINYLEFAGDVSPDGPAGQYEQQNYESGKRPYGDANYPHYQPDSGADYLGIIHKVCPVLWSGYPHSVVRNAVQPNPSDVDCFHLYSNQTLHCILDTGLERVAYLTDVCHHFHSGLAVDCYAGRFSVGQFTLGHKPAPQPEDAVVANSGLFCQGTDAGGFDGNGA